MVAVAIPSAVGSGEEVSFDIIRQPPGAPSVNTEHINWTAPADGLLWINIENDGLASVTIEIYDVTSAWPGTLVMMEPVRFKGDDFAIIDSSQASVDNGRTYAIFGTPGGPPDNGAILTVCFEPATGNLPPVAQFTGPTSGEVGELLTYDASTSYDTDGFITDWDWDFGNGDSDSGQMVSYSWSSADTYTVTLTVTDDDGDTDSASMQVEIIDVGPTRQVTFRIHEIGETYLKSTNYSHLGNRTETPGVNSWWPVRTAVYGETIVNDIWPYTIATYSSSPLTSPDPAEDWPWYLWTFYRMDIEALNLDNVNTASGVDPVFIPILDREGYYAPAPVEERLLWDGGQVTINWQGDYLTYQELLDIKSQLHYANTFYGVPRVTLADDGWWFELHGNMTFDRDASKKFLGLPGSGDLRDEFTALQDGSATGIPLEIDYAWYYDWNWEGGADGPYDTYTAYEYSQDLRVARITLDALNSTSEMLTLRMWTVSWGMEAQLMRYIEATGISPNWLGYSEDFSISGDVGPAMANFSLSYMICYNMLSWKDPVSHGAAWQLYPMHIDYGGNTMQHDSYISPYNPYDADVISPTPMAVTWTPGITHHGQNVFYMCTPMEMDLLAGETMIVELPMDPFIGYTPYAGTDDGMGSEGLELWKILQLASYSFYGDITIGACYPDMTGYYDVPSKTITLVGPIDFPTQPNDVYPDILKYGAPEFMFVVV